MEYDKITTDTLVHINDYVTSEIADSSLSYIDAGLSYFSIPYFHPDCDVFSIYENGKLKFRHLQFKSCHVLLKFNKNESLMSDYCIYPIGHKLNFG